MRRLSLIIALLLSMALVCSACSVSGIIPSKPPVVTPSPEPVMSVRASFYPVEYLDGSKLVPLYCSNGFFYCCSTVKSGEDIPKEAFSEAKKKKTDVVNDGRYDVFDTHLYKIRPNGSVFCLSEYVPVLTEENVNGWEDFCSVVSADALKVNTDGTLSMLEHVSVSGNSMPKDKTKYVQGRDYLEYDRHYYLRTLDRTGEELKSRTISASEASAMLGSYFAGRCFEIAGNSVLDSEGTVLFDFTDIGVDPSDICSPVFPDGEGYRFLCCDYDSGRRAYSYESVFVEISECSLETAGTVLLLGCEPGSVTVRLLSEIACFNRDNEEIHIRITGLDDSAADIIYTDNETCTEMAFAGRLADLYPYIDADPSFGRENFFTNIAAGAEHCGRLVSTFSGFSIDTVLGASSLVGDSCSWTYEEFRDAWGRLGWGTDAFDVYTTREDILKACLKADLSYIVSYDNAEREYNIDTDRLSQLTWFCDNFPESFDYSGRILNAGDATDMRIAGRRQMLLPFTLGSFDDVIICGYEFGEEVSFIGYPSQQGCGSVLEISTLDPGMNFSVTESCGSKDAAWKFIRRFFTGAYQTQMYKSGRFLPSDRRCFERGLKAAMSGEYAVDKKGELVHDKNGDLIFVSLGSMYLSDFSEVRYYPVSEQRAAAFRTLVETVSSTGCEIPDGTEIIEEICRQYMYGAEE